MDVPLIMESDSLPKPEFSLGLQMLLLKGNHLSSPLSVARFMASVS